MFYCRSGGLRHRVGAEELQHSLHALLQDGVPPGFADDEISPLDNDDTGKESRVAGVLYNFPALVRLKGQKEKYLHKCAKLFSRQ